MKKILLVLISLLAYINPANAVDLILSKNNLRLNNQANSLSFTVSLSDNLSGLSGSGSIPVKLKFKSKEITTNLTNNTVLIPYTDGVVGTSSDVVLTLNTTVSKSSTVALSFTAPGKFRKKYKVANSSKSINLDANAINITGKVTIPTGDLASFKSRTIKKLKARSINPFNTDSPDGVVVELVQVNPSTGEAVGEPIASAVTDVDGNYQIEMPPTAEFGPEYALVVEGDNNESMHAPLYSDNVAVNPATEALYELTQEAVQDPSTVGLSSEQLDFDKFTDTELEGLNDKMEDLNPLYEETLSDSIQSLKDSYASFLNNMIGVAADDDTSSTGNELGEAAKGVAGDYNVVFFDSSISSESNLKIGVELATARMSKPDEVGALTVTPYPSFSTQASLFEQHSQQGPDNGGCQGPDCGGTHNPGPDCVGEGCQQEPSNPSQLVKNSENDGSCFELEAYAEGAHEIRGTDGSGNFYMTIDPSRLISFAEPAFEETNTTPEGDTYTYRTIPSTMQMVPVGDDMFLSASVNVGQNINSSGTTFNYDAGFGSIIKRSSLTENDLTGEYGIVGIGYGLGTSSFSTTTFFGDMNFSSASVNFNVEQAYREAQPTSCGGSTYVINGGSEELSGNAPLEFQGDRVNITVPSQEPGSETLFTGFATSDAEILTLVYANDSGASGSRTGHDGQSRNVISNAERQIIFGVRKPKTQINLSGKNYRLLSAGYTFSTSGGRAIETGETGTLTFSTGTASVTNLTRTVYDKADASSEVVSSSLVVNEAAAPYTLSSDGSISITVGSDTWVGHVSSDARLIVFKSEHGSGLGMYLAVLQ